MSLMNLLQAFGQASDQLLSHDKCIFIAVNISNSRSNIISSILGFSVGHLPLNYLGVPIFKGKPKKHHLQPIVDKILVKLAAWKGSLLSIMGRVQLIKSIIHGMDLYSFHVYAWPRSLLKYLDRCIKNFIWSGDVSIRKHSQWLGKQFAFPLRKVV